MKLDAAVRYRGARGLVYPSSRMLSDCGVPQNYWDTPYGEVGDITRIQISIATHGQKRLRSALDGVVHNIIGETRPALPPFPI
ncbi:hypothetical protein TNCV_3138861 [Trichonephila clavipes]|nr:hypothetical protein TNCV_3138861 [Trichonephila clavipes]